MKKFFVGLLCMAGVAYLLGLGILVMRQQLPQQQQNIGDVNGVPFTVVDIASSTTVTSASKLVLGTSTSAQYRRFTNNSGNTIYLSFINGSDAVVNTGVVLFASSTIALSDESLYRGAVTAVSAGGNASLIIMQK